MDAEGEIIPPDRRVPVTQGTGGAVMTTGTNVPALVDQPAKAKAGKKKGSNQAAPEMPEANREVFAKAYVERMVNLMTEAQEIANDISDLAAEIKGAGLTPAAIKAVAKRQLETSEARAKREAVEMETDQILAALGMLADTPLGQAARQAA